MALAPGGSSIRRPGIIPATLTFDWGRAVPTLYLVADLDDVAHEHEAMRAIPATGEMTWIKQMRPITELCSGEQAQLFVRGLALAHMDATLRGQEQARRFLHADVQAELGARGIQATSRP